VFPSSSVWGGKVPSHLHQLETAAFHQWASDTVRILPPTHLMMEMDSISEALGLKTLKMMDDV
jgi:hypothetical protein